MDEISCMYVFERARKKSLAKIHAFRVDAVRTDATTYFSSRPTATELHLCSTNLRGKVVFRTCASISKAEFKVISRAHQMNVENANINVDHAWISLAWRNQGTHRLIDSCDPFHRTGKQFFSKLTHTKLANTFYIIVPCQRASRDSSLQ